MARNLPKFENNRFTRDIIIPYVPIMPAIQVNRNKIFSSKTLN